MSQVSEFVRESHRIDQQIWDGMALRAGERVLWAGRPAEAAWIERARAVGVDVTVIESDDERLAALVRDGIPTLRGSATMIPAREHAYAAAVAFHYLHEIDPSFHAAVVAELARVGRRVVLVEPAPPSDPLGRRIAQLYAAAKREAGAFEQYQPVDYWRKLLAIVKADVAIETLTFRRIPPKHAVEESIRLLLGAMEVGELPARYLDELRGLAARSDAQLLPLSRIVVIGAAAGELPVGGAGTVFRLDEEPEPLPAPLAPSPTPLPVAARTEYTPRAIAPELPAPPPAPLLPPLPSVPLAETVRREAEARAALHPPAAAPPTPAPEPAAPFGSPFAVAPADLDPFAGEEGFGALDASVPGAWSWEPPEEGDEAR